LKYLRNSLREAGIPIHAFNAGVNKSADWNPLLPVKTSAAPGAVFKVKLNRFLLFFRINLRNSLREAGIPIHAFIAGENKSADWNPLLPVKTSVALGST
jgi:hypothetical protein